MSDDIRAGTILVAAPALHNTALGWSVMMVLDHDAQGTRTVDLAGGGVSGPVKNGGPESKETLRYVGPFNFGGPVFYGVRDFDLHNTDDVKGVQKILSMLADNAVAEDGRSEGLFLCGDANWAPGKLDEEVKAGAWHKLDMTFDEVLKIPMEQRWSNLNQYVPSVPAQAEEPAAKPGQKPARPQGKHFRL